MDDEHFRKNGDDMKQQIEELTLLLLYLTSWEEEIGGDTVQRAWKGFPFEVLDALEENGYLSQSRRAKSVYLTRAGLERAEVLAANYLQPGADEC
jgi:hypothetical protein